MDKKIRNFRDLKIWQLGMEIVQEVYQFTKIFPKEELYGLVSQLRRAALSIPRNIAEGFNRASNLDYKRFLFISLGSIAEVETQIELSERLGFVSKENSKLILDRLVLETKMLRTLIKRLEEKA